MYFSKNKKAFVIEVPISYWASFLVAFLRFENYLFLAICRHNIIESNFLIYKNDGKNTMPRFFNTTLGCILVKKFKAFPIEVPISNLASFLVDFHRIKSFIYLVICRRNSNKSKILG